MRSLLMSLQVERNVLCEISPDVMSIGYSFTSLRLKSLSKEGLLLSLWSMTHLAIPPCMQAHRAAVQVAGADGCEGEVQHTSGRRRRRSRRRRRRRRDEKDMT